MLVGPYSLDRLLPVICAVQLSNEYGPTNISSGQFIRSEIPLRPRVLMAQFNWKF